MTKESENTQDKDKIIEEIYKSPAGLGGAASLYKELKRQGITGITQAYVKTWLASLETTQVSQPRGAKYSSFVARGMREQHQIDLIYMPKAWFNNWYKYIFACVDLFSKKAYIGLFAEQIDTSKNAVEGARSNDQHASDGEDP